jgi:hypothetical protein
VRRPTPSELAAGVWLIGGLVTTGVLQAMTGGRHSVSDGLRAHKLAFGAVAVTFLGHIYAPRLLYWVDPYRWSGAAIRAGHRIASE